MESTEATNTPTSTTRWLSRLAPEADCLKTSPNCFPTANDIAVAGVHPDSDGDCGLTPASDVTPAPVDPLNPPFGGFEMTAEEEDASLWVIVNLGRLTVTTFAYLAALNEMHELLSRKSGGTGRWGWWCEAVLSPNCGISVRTADRQLAAYKAAIDLPAGLTRAAEGRGVNLTSTKVVAEMKRIQVEIEGLTLYANESPSSSQAEAWLNRLLCAGSARKPIVEPESVSVEEPELESEPEATSAETEVARDTAEPASRPELDSLIALIKYERGLKTLEEAIYEGMTIACRVIKEERAAELALARKKPVVKAA